jgi:hypothetical protein
VRFLLNAGLPGCNGILPFYNVESQAQVFFAGIGIKNAAALATHHLGPLATLLLDLVIDIFDDPLQGRGKRLTSARALQFMHSFR